MDLCSLHPVTVDDARAFLAVLAASPPGRLAALSETSNGYPNALGHTFASYLADRAVSFVMPGVSLSTWEIRIDRGIGMLLRPPSRLFVEAGMPIETARRLPIRLDAGGGMMAGAYVPASLIPQLEKLLTERLERQARRLAEAEIDAVPILGLMLEAVGRARAGGTGLIEAADVFGTAGMRGGVVLADAKRVDRELRRRIELAIKPPKEPSAIGRFFGRRRPSAITTGPRGTEGSD